MAGFTFEQFLVGATFTTKAAVIADATVREFAKLTGDENPIHIPSPQNRAPIVHGMLVASVATGLVSDLGLTRGTLVALLEQRLQYRLPVRPGDTVHGKVEVIEKRTTRDPDRGIVVYRMDVVNQRNETVLEGTNTILVKTDGHRTPDGV